MTTAFQFPELAVRTAQRPSHCPRGGRVGRGRPRGQSRPVVDLKLSQVAVVQYHCEGGGASVTVTPPGLQPGGQHSDRTKVLSVVRWGLGPLLCGGGAGDEGVGSADLRRGGAAEYAGDGSGSDETTAAGCRQDQDLGAGRGRDGREAFRPRSDPGVSHRPEHGRDRGEGGAASREGEEVARWMSP